MWWRTPGRIIAFKVNQTLTSLQCSAVFQIQLCLIVLEAGLEHAMHVQSKERKHLEKDWQKFLTEFSAVCALLTPAEMAS